jgi:hypothetical protein
MNKLLIFLLIFISTYSHAENCKYGNKEDIGVVWKKLRTASIRKNASEVADITTFPFKLYDIYGTGKIVKKISKNNFIKNYNKIFVENPPGQKIFVFDEMSKSGDADYIRDTASYTDAQGCFTREVTYIYLGSYRIEKFKNNKWMVSGAFYSDTDLNNL